jgi:hypothetical protein
LGGSTAKYTHFHGRLGAYHSETFESQLSNDRHEAIGGGERRSLAHSLSWTSGSVPLRNI